MKNSGFNLLHFIFQVNNENIYIFFKAKDYREQYRNSRSGIQTQNGLHR